MPGLVKCDVCKKMFNARYLSSHKRMAHTQKEPHAAELKQQETMRKIVALYKELTAESRKKLIEQLAPPLE